MKYPKLLQRLETLEMVTYFHDDNAEDMYRNIMQIVATAEPQTKEQEHQIIYDTLYLLETMHYETLLDEPLREFEVEGNDSNI
ncbi:hypothetical protein [Enterococcus italicus]|uniref:hypothetical protein n=1 Tax=Enterococcus italicus TaxID=246144 RepID=UPI003F48E7A9